MSSELRRGIENFCQIIGQNRLLVQGAGGNISWKTGDSMLVKASGTWLADAVKKDIFVEVDYKSILSSLEQNDFSLTPQVICGSSLRPSIETILHALLPQKIVLHLHAVDILAFLVRETVSDDLSRLIPSTVKYALVDYFKPGPDLAKATLDAISLNPETQVVFLKNHGIVIGGDDIDELTSLLDDLCSYFVQNVVDFKIKPEQKSLLAKKIPDGYMLPKYDKVQGLALDQKLINRVRNDWEICPDHVVFLGAKAQFYNDSDSQSLIDSNAPFIFSEGLGVYESKDATEAQRLQLLCFYDVSIRISASAEIIKLDQRDVNELLDWDAEKYRLKINAV